MAVQPIDIQVNFSQMNTVSAEQTMNKQAILAAQADSTRHMIHESLKQAEKVKKIDDKPLGVTAINDDEEAPSAHARGGEEAKKPIRHHPKEEKPIIYMEDPEKGHEVDLMC